MMPGAPAGIESPHGRQAAAVTCMPMPYPGDYRDSCSNDSPRRILSNLYGAEKEDSDSVGVLAGAGAAACFSWCCCGLLLLLPEAATNVFFRYLAFCHLFFLAFLPRLKRCPLGSGGLRLGPAAPTGVEQSGVEVQQCPLGTGAGS